MSLFGTPRQAYSSRKNLDQKQVEILARLPLAAHHQEN